MAYLTGRATRVQGTYTLGLWWEQYGEEFLLHHAGDLAGMASKQAMLPLLGHAVVVLSNENESSARFVILLRILDFMLGLEPPSAPLGWQQRYQVSQRFSAIPVPVHSREVCIWTTNCLRNASFKSIDCRQMSLLTMYRGTSLLQAAEQASQEADAQADAWRRARVAALPAESRAPRWALGRYCGSFAHPAYGNATISISRGGATVAGWLQVCGAATIASAGESQPAVPACASLFHLGYEAFAVGVRELSQLRAGTNTMVRV